MASVASQLIEEVTAHAQRDSLEDAREICADGTYFPNNLVYGSISYIFFTQFETKCTFLNIILAEIIITFYLYVMTSTQLTAFVHLCSRNNNMTLRMAAVAVETCW